MSVPRPKRPSTMVGARPATPAATSGTHSTDERRLFSMRPPWFETQMPSAPYSSASSDPTFNSDAAAASVRQPLDASG